MLVCSDSSSDDSDVPYICGRRTSQRRVSSSFESSDESDDLAPPSKKRVRVLSDSSDSCSSYESDGPSLPSRRAVHCRNAVQSESDGTESELEGAVGGGMPQLRRSRERHDSSSDSDGADRCIICFKTLVAPMAKPSDCSHTFHEKCLATWSKTSTTCPIDRVKYKCIEIVDSNGVLLSTQRVATPPPQDHGNAVPDNPTFCEVCHQHDREDEMLLCDACDNGFHLDCLDPPLSAIPVGEWLCPHCFADDSAIEDSEVLELLAENVLIQSRLRQRIRTRPATARQSARQINRARHADIALEAAVNNFENLSSQPSTSAGTSSANSRRTSAQRPVQRRKRKRRSHPTTKYKVVLVTTEEGTTVEVKLNIKAHRRTKKKRSSKAKVRSRRSSAGRRSPLSSRNQRGGGRCSNAASTSAGSSSAQILSQPLDLFGSRPSLDYFSGCEAEDEDELRGEVGLLRAGSVARSGLTSRKQIAQVLAAPSRRRAPVSTAISAAPAVSLLDDILREQALWHDPRASIASNSAGEVTISVPESESGCRVRTGATHNGNDDRGNGAGGRGRYSGGNTFGTSGASGHGSGGGGVSVGGSSGGSGSGSGGSQVNSSSGGNDSAGGSNISASTESTAGGSGVPPIPTPPIPPLIPPPQPPLKLCEDDDFDLYADIETTPAVSKLVPPPEPPPLLLALDATADDGGSSPDEGLIIDDQRDTYDPDQPNSPDSGNKTDEDASADVPSIPLPRAGPSGSGLRLEDIKLPSPTKEDSDSEVPITEHYSKASLKIAAGHTSSSEEETAAQDSCIDDIIERFKKGPPQRKESTQTSPEKLTLPSVINPSREEGRISFSIKSSKDQLSKVSSDKEKQSEKIIETSADKSGSAGNSGSENANSISKVDPNPMETQSSGKTIVDNERKEQSKDKSDSEGSTDLEKSSVIETVTDVANPNDSGAPPETAMDVSDDIKETDVEDIEMKTVPEEVDKIKVSEDSETAADCKGNQSTEDAKISNNDAVDDKVPEAEKENLETVLNEEEIRNKDKNDSIGPENEVLDYGSTEDITEPSQGASSKSVEDNGKSPIDESDGEGNSSGEDGDASAGSEEDDDDSSQFGRVKENGHRSPKDHSPSKRSLSSGEVESDDSFSASVGSPEYDEDHGIKRPKKKLGENGANRRTASQEGLDGEKDGLVDITDEEISTYEKNWELENDIEKASTHKVGLEGLETEAISECEDGLCEDTHTASSQAKKNLGNLLKEEGEIITDDRNEFIPWKRVTKTTKERSYREKDKASKEVEKTPDKKKKEKKIKEKRKELERYDVRKIIGDKPKKRKTDEFGRDLSSSKSRSESRDSRLRSEVRRVRDRDWSKTRRRSRNRSVSRGRRRSLSKIRRRRSRGRSLDRSREKPKMRSRDRSRGRIERRDSRDRKRRSAKSSERKKSMDRSEERRDRSRDRPRERDREREKSREREKRQLSSSSGSTCSCSSCEREKLAANKITVTVPNKVSSKSSKKNKEKKKNKSRKSKKESKRRRTDSPVPSKEVFTSGDNILVSVNFKSSSKSTSDPKRGSRRVWEEESRKKKDKENQPARTVIPILAATQEKDKRKQRRKLASNAKPIAFIDLDPSPFREQVMSPTEVIVLTDSDHEGKEQGEKIVHQSMSTGPKTPPEPPVKFSISTKPQLRTLSNPLMETEVEDGEQDDGGDAIPTHKGPNTPPEPPETYDPFEPTKSRSPSPRGDMEAGPCSSPGAETADSPQVPASGEAKPSGSPPPVLVDPPPVQEPPGYHPDPTDMEFSPGGGGDSPYSPGSSEGDDLFEPPAPLKSKPVRAQVPSQPLLTSNLPSNKHNPLKLTPSPLKRRPNQAKAITPKKGLQGRKEIGIKLDEDQLKILDELPNSAVEMQVKDKFLKKLNRQERVVEEVKLVLKPHYNKKHVTKEEYKDILRKAVPKICHSRSGVINPLKIQHLIEAYVKKYRHRRKKLLPGGVPAVKPKPSKTLPPILNWMMGSLGMRSQDTLNSSNRTTNKSVK